MILAGWIAVTAFLVRKHKAKDGVVSDLPTAGAEAKEQPEPAAVTAAWKVGGLTLKVGQRQELGDDHRSYVLTLESIWPKSEKLPGSAELRIVANNGERFLCGDRVRRLDASERVFLLPVDDTIGDMRQTVIAAVFAREIVYLLAIRAVHINNYDQTVEFDVTSVFGFQQGNRNGRYPAATR